jgi:hypothetical protein
MSISHKKINKMISYVINNRMVEQENSEALENLCQKIYLIESSIGDKSAQQTLADIKEEIIRRSSGFSKD